MSILQSRSFANSAAHAFLQRSIIHWEGNVDRIVKRLHESYQLTMAPAPSVADEVARLCETDDVVCAQMIGGALHPDFLSEICEAVAASFTTLRGDLEPSRKFLAAVVGGALARQAEGLLSLAEKLSIHRGSISKEAAIRLCELKIRSHKARTEDSIASPGAWN